MNNGINQLIFNVCRFLPLLFILSLAPVQLHAQEHSAEKTEALLERLAINQGKGQFTQQKYFSFMSVPITSTGHFTVHNESALWKTQAPVFSTLLLTPEAIYRRLPLDENYQLLTDSAQFTTILSTIFTGKINVTDWQLKSSQNDSCLELTPKSDQLRQLFLQVDLCLVNEGDSTHQQRKITLTDSKGDKTIIKMTLNQHLLTSEDLDTLVLPVDNLGSVNAH